jgi:kinesin family protein 20
MKNLFTEEDSMSQLSEPIQVFLKIKPISESELKRQNNELLYKIHAANNSVSLKPPKSSVYAQNKQSMQTLERTLYQFSHIFLASISQYDFFIGTVHKCFESFFNGDNLLIFNYGVTNSGKTFTMQGSASNPGLIPRTLDTLFESLKDKLEMKKSVYKFKPFKFNEIISLSETELRQELSHKEMLLLEKIKINRVESCESLNKIAPDEVKLADASGGGNSLESSKKFGGSLDSLSTAASANCENSHDATSSIKKIRIPENKKYAIWISFYELYNDNIYDLLTIPDPKNIYP